MIRYLAGLKGGRIAGMTCLCLAVTSAWAEEELNVLGDSWRGSPPSKMVNRYLKAHAQAALDRRGDVFEALSSQDDIEAYQARRRAYLESSIGDWPERTPLHAQVVGRRTFDDYRMEKVIFESRPNFHVTATLRLPDEDPPYPGVLVPCGHSPIAKAYESYQRVSILLAKQGMASLCFDPIGQGERFQILDDAGKPALGGTLEHTLAGQSSILLGQNVANYFIWDGMRAIDYLISREEIDGERIGCTGNSGGGTQTTYLMALDDRIRAAAPSCYLTSIRRLIETVQPQDAEQNVYGAVRFGLEHADYIHIRAPKPTLMCTATQDFFDIGGSWATFREAKRLYTHLGFAERSGIIEADTKHGFHKPLREGAVQWMQRWLLDRDEPVSEPAFSVCQERALWCTPEGQVLRLEGERSVFELNGDLERELAAKRACFWSSTPQQEIRAKVAEVAGIRPLAELPEPSMERAGRLERNGYQIEKVFFVWEEGVALPALLFKPAEGGGDIYLYAHGEGKQADAQPGGPIESLVRQGRKVLAVDLRGIGETCRADTNKGWADRFGANWSDVFLAYLLGRSFVGMRSEDLLVLGRFLSSYESDGGARCVHLVAVGAAAVPAMHAAALQPDMFATVRLEQFLDSWVDVVTNTGARGRFCNVVHGALRYYDLPDLRGLVLRGRLILGDAVDAAGKVIDVTQTYGSGQHHE